MRARLMSHLSSKTAVILRQLTIYTSCTILVITTEQKHFKMTSAFLLKKSSVHVARTSWQKITLTE